MRRPIIRSLCRAALLLSVVFVLPVLLIRAQPYDDSDLRAFLTPPEDCPAPCFMDIRPGMTTAEEAVSILDAHPWVLWNKKVPASYQSPSLLTWGWSAQAPAWLDPQGFGFLTLYHEQVITVGMSTTISRATLMLTLGRPDSSCLVIAPKPKRLVFDYDAWYRDLGLKVNMEGLFPGAAMLYDWPVALEFRSSLPDTAPAWLLPRSHCQ